jgi:hypothetical protein
MSRGGVKGHVKRRGERSCHQGEGHVKGRGKVMSRGGVKGHVKERSWQGRGERSWQGRGDGSWQGEGVKVTTWLQSILASIISRPSSLMSLALAVGTMMYCMVALVPASALLWH